MTDVNASGATAKGASQARRVAALNAAIGVLRRLRNSVARNAVEMRRALEAGLEPDAKLIRSVEAGLLIGIMSPKLWDEDTGVTETKGLLAIASGILRLTRPLPTRQHVRRVYKEFTAAFSGSPSKPEKQTLPSPT